MVIGDVVIIVKYYRVGINDKHCRHRQVLAESVSVWRGSISKHQHVDFPA